MTTSPNNTTTTESTKRSICLAPPPSWRSQVELDMSSQQEKSSEKVPTLSPIWVNYPHPCSSVSSIEDVVVPCSATSVASSDEESQVFRTPGCKTPFIQFFYGNRGLFFAIISSFTFSLTAVLLKSLHGYDYNNVALWRFMGVVIPTIPVCIRRSIQEFRRRQKLPEKVKQEEKVWWSWRSWVLLLLRSMLSCNALLLHFFALNFISASDAIVVFSCSPVFAYGLAYFLLGESCGFVPLATSVLSLIGVGILQHPPFLTGAATFDHNLMKGTLVTLACALLSVISFITLRKSRSMPYSMTTLVYGVYGTLQNTAIVIVAGTFCLPHNLHDWAIAIILGVLAYLGQTAIVLALKVEQTGPVALIRTLDVIFGFAFDAAISRSIPNVWSLVGAGIVSSGIVITGLRKWLMSLPEDDKRRRSLRIFLL